MPLEQLRRESGGETIDIFAGQAGVLEFLFGEQVGRFAVEPRPQTDLTDLGFRSPVAFATALKCGNRVLTQWGHELSPFLSGRIVGLRRKTSYREGVGKARENLTAASAAYLNNCVEATRSPRAPHAGR